MDMIINGQNYPITGIVEDEALGPVPIIDLHVMSDYEWHVSCLKAAWKTRICTGVCSVRM